MTGGGISDVFLVGFFVLRIGCMAASWLLSLMGLRLMGLVGTAFFDLA